MIIGSHCSMSAKDYLLGSVKEALSYGANALMVYTGPPQNTRRKDIKDLKIIEAKELMAQNNIKIENLVIHAPYIINLANSVNNATFELGVNFLKEEIKRVEAIGAKYLVLHPGSHTTATFDEGINKIIEGLNQVLTNDQNVIVLLETMAGKGSEIGYRFEHLKYIIDNVKYNEKLGVCLDTCHIHDAGYDLNNIDDILSEFDSIIGLDRLKVIHLNNSKNCLGAKKDRHANLLDGVISLDALLSVYYHEKLVDVIKILETPYINDLPPYKEEIALLKSNKRK